MGWAATWDNISYAVVSTQAKRCVFGFFFSHRSARQTVQADPHRASLERAQILWAERVCPQECADIRRAKARISRKQVSLDAKGEWRLGLAGITDGREKVR